MHDHENTYDVNASSARGEDGESEKFAKLVLRACSILLFDSIVDVLEIFQVKDFGLMPSQNKVYIKGIECQDSLYRLDYRHSGSPR